MTGVTITILQRNDDNTYTKVVDAQPCTEIMEGWYHYVFSAIADKFYLYAIYPNDSRVQPESGFVDKRLNNLDQAVSDIRGGGGGASINISGIQTTIRNARDSIVEEMNKKHSDTIEKFNDTNSHIDIAKNELSNKIDSIEIPETILEEKEAKKAIKLITSVDKKLTGYIESEMAEKDEIDAITQEFTRQEIEDIKAKKLLEEEKKKMEEEEEKKEEELMKQIEEEVKQEFERQEKAEMEEKKKELEKELEETLKEAEEIKKELNSIQ